jgi:hypothetical protein
MRLIILVKERQSIQIENLQLDSVRHKLLSRAQRRSIPTLFSKTSGDSEDCKWRHTNRMPQTDYSKQEFRAI